MILKQSIIDYKKADAEMKASIINIINVLPYAIIETVLTKFTENEKKTIALRHYQNYSFKEIGNHLINNCETKKQGAVAIGVSADRALQIYNKAIRKLNHPTRLKTLQNYLFMK